MHLGEEQKHPARGSRRKEDVPFVRNLLGNSTGEQECSTGFECALDSLYNLSAFP